MKDRLVRWRTWVSCYIFHRSEWSVRADQNGGFAFGYVVRDDIIEIYINGEFATKGRLIRD